MYIYWDEVLTDRNWRSNAVLHGPGNESVDNPISYYKFKNKFDEYTGFVLL